MAQALVELDGKRYSIEPTSWRGRDVNDFAPRASVPGSGVVYSTLDLYQPLAQINWQRGFGYQWATEEAGYLRTEGNIDTRHEGLVMLYTKATSSHTNAAIKDGLTIFNGALYTWGDDGVWRFKDGAWEQVEVVFTRVNFDTPTNLSDDPALATSPKTRAFTMPTKGNNRMLLVHLVLGTSRTVTGVTYNGVAMTELNAMVGPGPYIHSWYLLNPTADGASHNVVVTWTGGTTSMAMIAQPFYYVNQATPFGTVVTSSSTGTSETDDVSSATGEVAIDILAKVYGAADALTIGADQTSLMLMNVGTARTIQSSYELGAATNTMSWSWTNSRAYAHLSVPVKPATDVSHKVNYMMSNGSYLFMFPDGARIQRSTNGGLTPADWLQAGANGNSEDYRWALIHGGAIYAGKDGSSEVYSDTTDDLSLLYGAAADDTQEIKVGAGTVPSMVARSFLQRLMVGRQDALYSIGEDRIARLDLDFGALASENNFRSMAVLGGRLMFPIRDRIFQWNGAVLVNQTPRRLTADFPYTTYGRFDNFVVIDPFMFITARTNESTYTESILVFDGVSWHRLLDPITDGDGSITMMGYDPVNHRLWYHVNKPTAGTNTTYYVPFQSESDFPYADFPTSGAHRLVTSRIEGGFRQIAKSSPRMFVTTQNCTSVRKINVYLSLDGDTEVLWAAITDNGVTELTWPLGLMSVEFDYCNIIFELVTDSETQSPIMEGYALMVLTRPGTKWGYSFAVHAASFATQGDFIDDRDAKQIKDDLRLSRQSGKPIKLVTPFGEEVWGYVTSLSEAAQEYNGEGPGSGDLEMEIVVNFVEVITPGEETDVDQT